MAAKGRTIACGPRLGGLLCRAIRAYAHAAFPPGGSECAQASRESMLEIAAGLEHEQATHGTLTLKGRQRGNLKGAVRVYFEELADLPAAEAERQRDLLLALLEGQPIGDDQLTDRSG